MLQQSARTAEDLLVEAGGAASVEAVRPQATGFEPLDHVLEGGFRAGDLVLVGGKPGVGKTIATFQWARNMALDGHTVVFANYEHPQKLMLARLLLLEVGALSAAAGLPSSPETRQGLRAWAAGWSSLDDVPDERKLLADARAAVAAYGDRLWLLSASTVYSGVPELEEIVKRRGENVVLFVDYLQKVASRDPDTSETGRAAAVGEGLKTIALEHGATLVAVVASTEGGLTARRQRLHHLRGAGSLAYDCDVAFTLNEKVDAVSRVHTDFDLLAAERFREWVVVTVEKHRGGPALQTLEFRKDFEHWRFEPQGTFVTQHLVDESPGLKV